MLEGEGAVLEEHVIQDHAGKNKAAAAKAAIQNGEGTGEEEKKSGEGVA